MHKLLLIILLFLLGGCVERRMEILSDPPGARVFLDEKPIGETPVNHNFHFYGQRSIRVYKKGYEVVKKPVVFKPPIHQIFPLDFFVEFLWPFTITDEHFFQYTLQPSTFDEDNKKELIQRAKDEQENDKK